MKKMLVGFVLLAILFVGVIINSIYLENMLTKVKDEIKTSYSLSDTNTESALKNSLNSWESKAAYINIILSDGKHERISEAFFECISQPEDLSLRDKLIYEIDSLIKSEKISINSIF